MENNIIKSFNLPSYVKGKTFAQASKEIESKFKDRHDKTSLDTKKQLLDRLSKAQEHIKSLEEPVDDLTNDYFFGGIFNQSQNNNGKMQAIGSGLNSAFPNTNQSQMGVLEGDEAQTANTWESTKDAVSNIGPFFKLFRGVEKGGKAAGQAIAGDKGGDFATGFLDPMSNKTRKDYNFGEKLAGIDPLASGILAMQKNKKRRVKQALKDDMTLHSYFKPNEYRRGGPMDDNGRKKGTPESMGEIDYTRRPNVDQSVLEFKPYGIIEDVKSTNEPTYEPAEPSQNRISLEDVGDFFGRAARYAPVATNAYQLATLEKPDHVALERLGSRYIKDLVDEQSLQNIVDQEAGNVRRALIESSGGDLGALRGNLIASQLASTKALSNAYMDAENINRGEGRVKQQFDLGVDQFNIGQSNLQEDINARNIGAYNTARSGLIGQLGENIGDIGKEETYKQMVLDSGLCYDTRGAYRCGSGERLTEEEVKTHVTNSKAKGGYMYNKGGYMNESTSLFNNYLDKVLKKK